MTRGNVINWLTDLPEPYWAKAFANLKESSMYAPAESMQVALWKAFSFDRSHEGREFWDAVIRHYDMRTMFGYSSLGLWFGEKVANRYAPLPKV